MSQFGRGMGGAQDELTQLASMKMMLGTISVCFDDCVTAFSSSDLTSSEKSCLNNCTRRETATFELLGQVQGQLGGRAGF